MFRQSIRRFGHQLIKEPLPNQEHNTSARGVAAFNKTWTLLQSEATFAGVGLIAAAATVIVNSQISKSETIDASGQITSA